MKKLFSFIYILSFLTFLGCNDDILDTPPQDSISEGIIWDDESLVKAYHTSLYNSIYHGFNIHMLSKVTDEAYCAINWDVGNIPHGTLTPDNVTSMASWQWHSGANLYIWDPAFQWIRKINVFLERMNSEEAIEFEGKARLIAEAKFLRGYVYFMLIERFGGAPIVKESFKLDAGVDFTKSSFEDCVEFIESDLTAAYPDLPKRYTSNDANFGRATQDAVQALRSRMYLYAASPLFNPTNDKAKWQKAADETEPLLDAGYELHPDYTTLFNQPSGSTNNELIFVRPFAAVAGGFHEAPMHNLNRRYGAYGGWWASNGPSQNLVDDYDMINGEPAFIYQDGEKVVNPASEYDPQQPYVNRDPRFYATIIYDGASYHGDVHEMWVASDGESWGFDSYRQSGDNPRTNYVLRKFMPGEGTPLAWGERYTNPWIIFRLGEIYLNYAEAMFELGDEDACRDYISKVRERVNMPAIPETVTGEELRDRLRNERRIELAFEEHRYWDVRRWKIAMEVENAPIYGMDIIKDVTTGGKTYSPVQLLERHFEDRMHLLPIETNEVRRNPELDQTVGWEAN